MVSKESDLESMRCFAPVAPASAGLMVPTSSSRISLLQAFRRGPGTYRVFAGPRYGQYQPYAAHTILRALRAEAGQDPLLHISTPRDLHDSH